MSAIEVQLPMLPREVVVPDTIDDLLAQWAEKMKARLDLYAGKGGPAKAMQFRWTPTESSERTNWRGRTKTVEGSSLLDSNEIMLPNAAHVVVEQTFSWSVDRSLWGDFWVHVCQPGGQWHGIAFNLYPKGPWMRPGDRLEYKVRFVGTE